MRIHILYQVCSPSALSIFGRRLVGGRSGARRRDRENVRDRVQVQRGGQRRPRHLELGTTELDNGRNFRQQHLLLCDREVQRRDTCGEAKGGGVGLVWFTCLVSLAAKRVAGETDDFPLLLSRTFFMYLFRRTMTPCTPFSVPFTPLPRHTVCRSRTSAGLQKCARGARASAAVSWKRASP